MWVQGPLNRDSTGTNEYQKSLPNYFSSFYLCKDYNRLLKTDYTGTCLYPCCPGSGSNCHSLSEVVCKNKCAQKWPWKIPVHFDTFDSLDKNSFYLCKILGLQMMSSCCNDSANI
jgi:hypothetical protein